MENEPVRLAAAMTTALSASLAEHRRLHAEDRRMPSEDSFA